MSPIRGRYRASVALVSISSSRLCRCPRDLAANIRKRGQPANVLVPGLEDSFLNAWIAQVVEHKGNFRALLDELGHCRKLVITGTDLKYQFRLGQPLHPGDKLGTQTKVHLRFGLHQMPDSLNERAI